MCNSVSRVPCPLNGRCAAQDEVTSLKSKLEECKTQLQSNEQMIRWLNNQVRQEKDAQHSSLCELHMLLAMCHHLACSSIPVPDLCKEDELHCMTKQTPTQTKFHMARETHAPCHSAFRTWHIPCDKWFVEHASRSFSKQQH